MVYSNLEGDCFAIARNDGLRRDWLRRACSTGFGCFVIVPPPRNDGKESEDRENSACLLLTYLSGNNFINEKRCFTNNHINQ